MENIPLLIEFVNAQYEFHLGKSREFREKSPIRADRHEKTAAEFRTLHDALTALWHENETIKRQLSELQRQTESLPSSPNAPATKRKQFQLSLTLDDIKDLPEELIKELSFSDGDKMDFTLQAIINENGGVMSLDQILVALYRQTKVINKRQLLNARLYRMVSKGVLFGFPGKKGVYSTRELSPQDAAALNQSNSDTEDLDTEEAEREEDQEK